MVFPFAVVLLALAGAQGTVAEPQYDPEGPRAAHHNVHPPGSQRSEAFSRKELPVDTKDHRRALAPLPSPDDPVMAGYDLVEYHKLADPQQDGVRGSSEFSYRHSNGYMYYFSNQANRLAFIESPEKYLPKYGGFCAWGVAWEYPAKGWPWAADHMGPPCGPRDGWAIIDGSLYCSIWRSYQDDFNARSKEGIRLADARWKKFYGSLSGGPQVKLLVLWD